MCIAILENVRRVYRLNFLRAVKPILNGSLLVRINGAVSINANALTTPLSCITDMLRVSASTIAIICHVGLVQALNLQSAIFSSDPVKNWAVLVAGSSGWLNYRHQSDVCHAYQILTGLGVPKENIITFMYDDIAKNPKNPYPGEIHNDYSYTNVYAGVQIDYKGSDVDPRMFLRVMKGDEQLKADGRKVLQSGPADNVFVFFAGHGADCLICFPEDDSKVADSMPSSRAHLVGLIQGIMRATTEDEHDSAKRRLHRALQMGTIVEHTFDDIITDVEKRHKPSGNQMDKLEQLKCFEGVFEVFRRHCFTIQQVPEVAQHVSKLHQLCRSGYQPEDLIDSVMNVCV
ncbi:legumain [Paragonimus westermani]|uniref:Legumain n=1 Tax=Paragonimus westermani TaxID=34504 RepID=A0A5J4NLM4_9TREM|nr:legumain [Paragonimus westermani]